MEETLVKNVLIQAPAVAILLWAVVVLWRKLQERDKALAELLERYHQDSARVSNLLDRIFQKLGTNCRK